MSMIDYRQMTSYTTTFKDRIIFLDIDGVLNGYNRWNVLGWNIICKFESEKLRNWYRKLVDVSGIHTKRVKRLAEIVRKTGAKVVMSSSRRGGWRYDGYKAVLKDNFKEFADFTKLDNLFKLYGIELIDITPRIENKGRDSEIIQWLAQHEDKVDNFIILDDENSFMKAFWNDERFIQTSEVPKGIMIKGLAVENTGLRRKHVKQAIRVLTKERKI